MDTVENQKVIIVQKEELQGKGMFTSINYDAIDYAAIQLKNESFKLWLYIAKNSNNYTFALSRIAYCNWSGCTKPTYLKAVQTLTEKGFLVKKKEGSNQYYFYVKPSEATFPKTPEDIEIEMVEHNDKQEFKF